MNSPRTSRVNSEYQRSFSKYFFLLAINSYGLNILLNLPFMSIVGHFILGITLISLVTELVQRRNSQQIISSDFRPLIKDYPRLIINHLRANKKYVAISIIGMVFVILILSQSMLMASTYRYESVKEIIDTDNNQALQITASPFEDKAAIDAWHQDFNNEIPKILKNNRLKLDTSDYGYSSGIMVKSGELVNDTFETYLPVSYYSMTPWEVTVFEVLSQFPTFNISIFDASMSLLIISQWDNITHVRQDNEVQVVIGEPYTFNDTLDVLYYNISITQTWQPSQSDYNYIEENQLFHLYDLLQGSILTNQSIFWNDFNAIKLISDNYYTNKNPGYEYNPMILLVRSSVFIEFPNLLDISLTELQTNLERTRNQVNNWANSYFSKSDRNEFGYAYVDSPLLNLILQYVAKNPNFDTTILLVSLPFYALTIFLLYFMMNLVENRRKSQVSILKSRGATQSHIQSFLLSELIVSLFISILIGMFLSISWTEFTLNQSKFNQIGFKDTTAIIPNSWYWKVPTLGAMFSLNIHFLSSSRLLSTKIEEGDDAIESPSFISRFNIDVIFFAISLMFWIIVNFINFENQSTYLSILTRFGPVMLFAFFLSFTLIVGKYISALIHFLSKITWKTRKGIIALGTINLVKNRFSSSKLAALLTMSIMLSMISITVPNTYVDWGVEKASYDLGTEIYVDGLTADNQTIWNYLNISGVDSYSEVAKAQLYGGGGFDDLQFGGASSYTILGINTSTFASAAYWKDKYDDYSLNEITKKIISNNTVAVSNSGLKSLGLKIGDSLTINYGFDFFEPKLAVLEVVQDFDYFPNLVTEPPEQDGYDLVPRQNEPFPEPFPEPTFNTVSLLTNISLVRQMKDVSFSFSEGAYVKTKENANVTLITEKLQEVFSNFTSVSVHNYKESLDQFLQDDETRVTVLSLQVMFILAMIINALAIAYFTFTSISDRTKEIGVFRAIGMKNLQLFTIFFVEAFFLFFLGIVSGSLGGLFLSSSYFQVISQSAQSGSIPPISMNIPWESIGLISLIMASLAVLASAVPAWILSSKQTGNILREV